MTDPIRVLLVDDEPLARASLAAALADVPGWMTVAEAADAAEAREMIRRHTPDVVFLDIRMPGETGLSLARDIAGMAQPPIVVFLTAHDSHAVDAFAVHALDYLLKPLDDARLAEALERVQELRALTARAAYGDALRRGVVDATVTPSPYLTQFCVRSVGRLDVVDVVRVRWIHAAGNYLELHMTDGRMVLHRAPLGAVADRLDPADFIRVHRSTIVRRAECVSLQVAGDRTYRLKLSGGGRVTVSARYVDDVRAVLMKGN